MKKQALSEAISRHVDVDLSELFKQHLEYKDDSVIVNFPSPGQIYTSESQDDECYVWAGFLPAGNYKFVVDDPLIGATLTNVIVGARVVNIKSC
jgi:hypothetical protein